MHPLTSVDGSHRPEGWLTFPGQVALPYRKGGSKYPGLFKYCCSEKKPIGTAVFVVRKGIRISIMRPPGFDRFYLTYNINNYKI